MYSVTNINTEDSSDSSSASSAASVCFTSSGSDSEYDYEDDFEIDFEEVDEMPSSFLLGISLSASDFFDPVKQKQLSLNGASTTIKLEEHPSSTSEENFSPIFKKQSSLVLEGNLLPTLEGLSSQTNHNFFSEVEISDNFEVDQNSLISKRVSDSNVINQLENIPSSSSSKNFKNENKEPLFHYQDTLMKNITLSAADYFIQDDKKRLSSVGLKNQLCLKDEFYKFSFTDDFFLDLLSRNEDSITIEKLEIKRCCQKNRKSFDKVSAQKLPNFQNINVEEEQLFDQKVDVSCLDKSSNLNDPIKKSLISNNIRLKSRKPSLFSRNNKISPVRSTEATKTSYKKSLFCCLFPWVKK